MHSPSTLDTEAGGEQPPAVRRGDAGGCPHTVLFYRDDAAVFGKVAAHIISALRSGAPALVIAKPRLVEHVTIDLHREHVDGTPFGPGRGRLLALDAAATLERVCTNGRLDAARFERVIGEALDVLETPGRDVTAYGEMVGILCERGDFAAAVELERMWGRLLAKRQASLLCGYSQRLFSHSSTRGFYRDIRAAHDAVLGEEAAA